jgi:anti-anti-sigma factor
MLLRITRTEAPRGLRLEGEVDISNVEDLERALNEIPAGRNLSLDLVGLTFIDVRGLHLLAQSAERLDRAGSRLILMSPPSFLQRHLRILGLDQFPNLQLVRRDAPIEVKR